MIDKESFLKGARELPIAPSTGTLKGNDVGRLYKHIKSGKFYYVLNLGVWEEDNEKVVFYSPLDENHPAYGIIFARKLDIFKEKFKKVKLG